MQDERQLKVISYSLIVGFIVLVTALSVLAMNRLKSGNLEHSRASLQAVLLTVQRAHEIWLEQRLAHVRELAASPEFVSLSQPLLQLESVDSEQYRDQLSQLRQWMRPRLNQYGDEGFFLIDQQHRNAASMRDENLAALNLIYTQKPGLLDRSFRGESVLVPPLVSDVALRKESGEPRQSKATLFVTAPLRSTAGNVVAVLALRIDPAKHFSRLIHLGRLGHSGETYAFDERGMLLTASRFDPQLTQLGLLHEGQSSVLNVRLADPGGKLSTGFRPRLGGEHLPLTLMASSALAGHSSYNIEGYRDYRGVTVIGAWAWQSQYGFGIATEADIDEALLPYYHTRNILIATIVLTSLLGFMLRNVFVRLQRHHQQRLEQAYDGLEQRVQERTRELQMTQNLLSQANEELQLLAITDGLTGLHNRRYFDDCLVGEWQRCQRDGKRLAVLLFDVDYFKPYNDNYGHQHGDSCLQAIGKLLLELGVANRPGDCIARYGGEEFVVFLVDVNEDYAQRVAEQLRQRVAALKIPHRASGIEGVDWITVSLGLAIELAVPDSGPDQLLNRADRALYTAKDMGRNRVCRYRPEMQQKGEVLPLRPNSKAP